MKKMKLLGLFLLFTLIACGQKKDDTFTKPMYFNFPAYFPAGIYIGSDPTLHLTWGGTGSTAWADITGKPLTFPPSAHNHDLLYKAITYVPSWTEITGKPTFATIATTGSYSDLLNKPGEVELNTALKSLPAGVPILILTQTQINALVIPSGESKIVYNSTDGVMQFWSGSKWIIFATTNN